MRALLLGILLTALLASVPSSSAAPVVGTRDAQAELHLRNHIAIEGVLRYGRTVKVSRGTWNRTPDRYHFQWFRNESEIPGATGQAYRLGVADVGQRIKARVFVKKHGFAWAQATARGGTSVGYRVPVRRTVTYRIETRGHLTTSVREFARLAAQTYADPRGWRNAGVEFRRVKGASDFSLVLAEASWLPRFSGTCSAEWSCRAGRYVVINQMRWKYASTTWYGAGRSLRDYRNLVVDHETGHWLGHGHLGCPGAGRLAPVMMQQSKGLDGCRANPWPLPSELWSR